MKWLRRFIHWFLSKNDWFWRAVSSVPWLRRFVNWLFISVVCNSTSARPHPFSLWSPGGAKSLPADYTSWTGLTDRTFTGRHLPPASAEWCLELPDRERLRSLFERRTMVPCPRSSVLFCFFAQWFTDSFLRTDPHDNRRNTSNHEIDLCQIYGLSESDTGLLRSRSGGRLRSEKIGELEYPEKLFEEDGVSVRNHFLELSYIDPDCRDYANDVIPKPFNCSERKKTFFATGLELGNSNAFYTAISTIFLREHNRLCAEIESENPGWNDDRIFEAARNTNIAQLLKIIVEDYINHLSSTAFKLFVDVGSAERQGWYRTNRIAAEFDLLYRWHALVPDHCEVDDKQIDQSEFRYNNEFLVDRGVEALIGSASVQCAGRIQLQNSPAFLVEADLAAVDKSRAWRIRSYNDYRDRFGLPRVRSFPELTGEKVLAAKLSAVYKSVDQVELMAGLLAEERNEDAVFGDLMSFMVGSDAFSQALTNPLLAKAIFNEETFSSAGHRCLVETSTIDQIVQRNATMKGRRAAFGI